MPNSRKRSTRSFPAGAAVLILAILLCTAPAFPQEERPEGTAGRPPVGRWYTLKSDNFLIHFTEGSEHLARRVADIAEDVHAKLSVEIKSKPSGRTHIMLRDWYDSVNGWASPLPRNTIAVYPVGPGLSELELTFTDDWLRLLITHEYVHILTMDMAGGVPGLFRKIFGRSMATVPNAFMPLWIIEGYAVYHETKHTRGGRARGPYFDMILRAASLDGKFNTISQAQSGIDSWPSAIQYIYGGMFCQYLADRFGEDRLLEIYRRQSRVIGPVLPWVPGQWHDFRSIDLAAVHVKGTPGDVVTVVGGTW